MKKINYKQELKELYTAKKEPKIVEVPQMKFLMIDGKGNPNTSQDFQDAINALFPLAYTIKFMIKKSELEIDYGVLPIEGMWWADDIEDFKRNNKDNWKWTLMIMQPPFVEEFHFKTAFQEVKKKKDPTALSKVRFASFKEGLSAQIMHIGPYSEEGPTIEKLHDFITNNGYQFTGKHREIYLSDVRRAKPENLKTIIRQPIIR